jgi:death on curing protein
LTEVRYLTAADVLAIHRAEVGEPVVDLALFESAVARPKASNFGEDAYPDIASKAAALFHSLVRNHAFLDGNERTAVLALIVFCGLNGYSFDATDDDLVDLALETAAGQLDVEALAERIGRWSGPVTKLAAAEAQLEQRVLLPFPWVA